MKKLLVLLLWFPGFMLAQEVAPFAENGKFSLRKGNVNVQPGKTYDAIDKVNFPEYELNGRKYNYIFVLFHGKKVFYNNEGTDCNIQLAKADGSLISDQVFNTYILEEGWPDSPNGFVVHSPEKQIWISPLFEVVETEYTRLEPFMDWFIADDYEQSYILDQNLKVLHTFDKIEFLTETQYVDGYEGYFETIVDLRTEPVLTVYKYIDGQQRASIFELNESKSISPWMEEGLTPELEIRMLGDQPLYLYSNAMSDAKGYFRHGMKSGTEISFDRCNIFQNDGFWLLMTLGTDSQFYKIFHLRGDSLVKVTDARYAIPSSELVIYDDESNPEGRKFREDFIYTENESEQKGIICLNGKAIDPQYEMIYPDPLNDYIVHTQKEQQYGFVNLRTGKEVKPFSDSVVVFEKLGKGRDMYTTVRSGKTKYYLSADGNKFYSLKSEPVVFGKKKLLGLQSVSDFTGKKTNITPPIYTSIVKVSGNLYIVGNSQQKYGVINAVGDTVIALKYEQLSDAGIDNYWSGRSFYFYKKSGNLTLTGLVTELQGEVIPAVYHKIQPYGDPAKMYNMYMVSNGKHWGLYSGNSMVFDTKYEAVDDQYDMYYTDNHYYLARLGEKSFVRFCYGVPGQYYMQPASRAYDHVIGNFGYVKSGDQFQRYDLTTGNFLQTTADLNSSFSNEYFSIICQDGKWGAESTSSVILVPYSYDEAYFKPYENFTMIAREKGVWYEVDVNGNSRTEIK